MQKPFKKCILSEGRIDVSLQGLKIVRVSAGDQHMGALTKEGKAGFLRCLKEVVPLCLLNGGFHKWGYPNSWMVCKWKIHLKMDDDSGYPHDYGNRQISHGD